MGQTCRMGTCGAAEDQGASTDLSGDGAATVSDMSGGADMIAPAGCKNPGAILVPDLAACNSLPGFFAADQSAYWMGTMSQETCGNALANQLFYGCGNAGRAGVKMCGGFPKVIDLGTGWTSTNGTLAQAMNTNPAYGVLCCKGGQKAVACPGAFAVGQAAQQCAPGFAPCQALP